MGEATKACTRCGSSVGVESRQPLCAACLAKMGLRPDSAEVIITSSGSPAPRPPPAIAELAPHFPQIEIQELVGQGGMGVVYRARQRSLGRDVALKVLSLDTSADPSFAERFEREARTLAGLSHPGIVTIFDFGKCGEWWYFVMEFVDGANLRQMLRARQIGSGEALSIVAQVCDVLQYAHEQGVVHRDIKPENVLVTRKGQVKILDFGLAKLVDDRGKTSHLTRSQQVMGTLHYMAPEQWEKPLTVDHRADIYALGVVFYELLTGELPLGRFAPPSHKAHTDVRLDEVVLKTLEKEPDQRYQHASEVKRDVQSVVDGTAHAPAGHAASSARRRWSPLLVAGGVLGVVLALTVLWFVQSGRASDPGPGPSNEGGPAPGDLLGDLAQDPKLRSEEAESHGFAAGALAQVEGALEKAWRDYLALEQSQSRGTWRKETELQVDVAAFPGKRDALLASLEDALSRLSASPSADGPRLVTQSLRKRMTWGERAAGFEIHRLPGVGWEVTSKASSQDIIMSRPVPALEPAYQRQWDRFLAARSK